ncbi:MAG TPA: hypothetical protein GX392_04560 [Clostridiales bacterium]|nr:hypothetical protein [Clostridiales bacterium]
MGNGFFTNIGYLQKALDATWQRDEIISHNISNIDTPNYKSQGISFESFLLCTFFTIPLQKFSLANLLISR